MATAADNSTTGRCAAITQHWTRQVTSLLYRPGADYASGDEDNGQLSTYYLLAAIGLYDLSLSANQLLIGSPLFTSVTINMPSNKTLNIVADGNCPTCYYVQSVTWNGAAVSGTTIPYTSLSQGGTLHFVMGDTSPSGFKAGPNPRERVLKAGMKRSAEAWHSGVQQRTRERLEQRGVEATA
jgi:putative alpha-1,2-mannosidase